MDQDKFLATIVNPQSGALLAKESRIIDLQFGVDQFLLKYKRDGISPEQKKEIERQIIDYLKPHYEPSQIQIMTISENSKEVFGKTQEVEKKEEAQLQVGHGSIGQKKKVNGVKKIIAIASGKGGVGKSTFAVNFALSLKKMGKKVGLLDADIYGPSLPMMLGKRDEKPQANADKKILPVQSFGLDFMSFGFFVGESEAVIWRGPMLNGVLNQFLFDVAWNELDYLIVDLPPGTGDVQLSMVQNTQLDAAIVISTPQDIAFLDAKRAIAMFQKVQVPILGVVENMSSFICDSCEKVHYLFGKEGVRDEVEKLEIPFLGAIPLDPRLREGADQGVPFLSQEKFNQSEAYRSYLSIAEKISPPEKKGLFAKLFKK